jgi:hypothetical protein
MGGVTYSANGESHTTHKNSRTRLYVVGLILPINIAFVHFI